MKKKSLIIISVILISLIVLVTMTLFLCTPRITLNGRAYMTISIGNKYKEPGYKANNYNKDITSFVKVQGEVNTSKIGTYKIKYMIKENNLTKTIIRKVKVIDNIKPQITLVSGNEVKICPNIQYQELGYTAHDNYDGDLTSKVKITRKGNKIIYGVSDSSKNKSQVQRTINIIDDEKPVITLSDNNPFYLIKGNTYIEKGYLATDNCNGDLTSKVQISNNININEIGTYQVNYSVKDIVGNEGLATRTVKVIAQPQYNSSTIYLTFDDGPSSITPEILNILEEEEVKATFFVLNRSDSYNYLLKRIVAEGHSIGLHGNSHDYYSVYASVDSYYNDITTIENKVKNVTGVKSKIIRFIGGSSNTVSRFNPGIMTVLTAKVQEWGYHYYDWNISSSDTGNITSGQLYNNVVNSLGSKATYIVIMHDCEGNNKTVAALRDVIRYGKNAGYKFDRIIWNTPQLHHKINN